MLCFWSAKGGSGCSVVVAAMGVMLAREGPTLVVDLAGDMGAILGVDDEGPGLVQWLSAVDPSPEALARLEIEVAPNLGLLSWGDLAWRASHDGIGGRGGFSCDRPEILAHVLGNDGRNVVVDVGTRQSLWGPLLASADRSVLVTKACYLGLRRLPGAAPADVIVVVREPGRALGDADIEAAAGSPVGATVAWDPAIARAVDAGTLAQRLPRRLKGIRTLA